MIYTRLDRNNTEITDIKQIVVEQTTSDNNNCTNFAININNQAGYNSGTFAINDNIKIYASEGILNGCIGLWNFYEGSGSVSKDLITGMIGSNLGNYSWNKGSNGSFIGLGGTGRVGVYDTVGSFNLGNQDSYSVSVWFNSSSPTKDQSISEHWQEGGYPWAIRGPNDGGVGFGIYAGAGSGNPFIYPWSGAWNNGSWHHVVGVRDYYYTSSTPFIALYLDGKFIGSTFDTTSTSGGDVRSTANGFAIGARGINLNLPLDGSIAEFRVYNRPISQTDVNSLWNNGNVTLTKKLINATVEATDNFGEANTETIDITGRDYAGLLQDVTVTPRVYKNKDVGYIVKDIITTCTPTLSASLIKNIGITIDRIVFNHTNCFDAIYNLAQRVGYYFYVDNDLKVHFEPRVSKETGLIFNNTNSISDSLNISDREVYNKVWVYGKRILTGANQEFTANGGSVFNLTDKPSNTTVFVNGSISQPGGVINISDPETMSIKWVVDYDEKQVIFVSGTAAGDNIPSSGADISINYDRSTPIIKYVQDNDSIAAYGPKVKVINDDSITTSEQATNRANVFLAENKDAFAQADLTIKGLHNFTVGDACGLSFPFQNIESASGIAIIQARYDFNPESQANEQVTTLRLNKRIYDLTDTLKEIILNQKRIETGDIEGEVTEFKIATGSTLMQTHWEVYTRNIGSAFLLHVPTHDILESPTSLLGNMLGDYALLISGGDF